MKLITYYRWALYEKLNQPESAYNIGGRIFYLGNTVLNLFTGVLDLSIGIGSATLH